MHTRFVLLILVFLSNNSIAQVYTFEKNFDTLGCYYSNCVVEYIDKGYILCGSSYNITTAQDAAIIRIDSLGNVVWVKQYGTPSTDGALKCVTTNDSGILIVGIKEVYSTTNGKLWILKLDQNGDTLWTKTYKINTGRSMPTDVESCKSGGFIISGFCSTQISPDAIAMLIKIDSIGNLLWSKTYNNNSAISEFYSCKEIIGGSFLCTGGVYNSSQTDIYIVQTDSLGDTLWTKSFGSSNVDFSTSAIQSQDSNIIMAGSIYDTILNNWNIDLYKLSLSGNIIWHKILGDNKENTSHTLLQLADGNFLIGGTTRTTSNDYQGLIIKVDVNGDTMWVSTFGSPNSEIGYDVIESSDGGIVFTGKGDVLTPNPHSAMYCIKLDSLGQINTKVKEVSKGEVYTLYPNPANDFIRIKSTLPFHKISISIIDNVGRKCNTGSREATALEFDVSHLLPGLYFLLINEGNETITKAFIKQ